MLCTSSVESYVQLQRCSLKPLANPRAGVGPEKQRESKHAGADDERHTRDTRDARAAGLSGLSFDLFSVSRGVHWRVPQGNVGVFLCLGGLGAALTVLTEWQLPRPCALLVCAFLCLRSRRRPRASSTFRRAVPSSLKRMPSRPAAVQVA